MSIALFSFLGIVVGAGLQYLFTQRLEGRRHFKLLQTQAYADYLRGVAEAAHLSLRIDEAELYSRIADAKTRVCMYGSSEVIDLLAEFETEGGMIGTEQQRKVFLRIVQAMRGNSKIDGSKFGVVLFGKDEGRP